MIANLPKSQYETESIHRGATRVDRQSKVPFDQIVNLSFVAIKVNQLHDLSSLWEIDLLLYCSLRSPYRNTLNK